MTRLDPFGDAAGTDIGDLHVETDADELVISGSLSIRRDERGLLDVRRLRAILEAAEAAIASSPAAPPETLPSVVRPNPFGSGN